MDGLVECEEEKKSENCMCVFNKLELCNWNQDETWRNRCEFEGDEERIHPMDLIISFGCPEKDKE